MIVELRVRNLATVADVTLPLGPGFNVLTGETGAGKSMLVDALALLLGERADSKAVRPGADKTVVEGVVEGLTPLAPRVESLGLDVEEGRLVIRREVSREGRSRAWVNGSPTTAAVLRTLASMLLDIHGQHETQSLLKPEVQRDLLDAYAGAAGEQAAVSQCFHDMAELRERRETLEARRGEALRRADYLRHVVAEIEKADTRQEEYDELLAESRLLGEADRLEEISRQIVAAVDEGEGNALGALAVADRALANLEKLDPAAGRWRELLDGAWTSLTELADDARRYAEAVDRSPERLAEVNARLDLLADLKRKYGGSIEEVLTTLHDARAELSLVDSAEVDLAQLSAREAAARAAFEAACDNLTAKRTSGSGRLSRAVNRLLPRLGLPNGRLEVGLSPREVAGAGGAESVQFLVSLNQGMETRPLSKTASGGELSRIMLALKTVLAQHDQIPILVFDEIDQGVGGEVGAAIGSALAEVAGRRQVMVITHLPQIAGAADRHLVVSKGTEAGMATSRVSQIHGEDRVLELARMLGGADSGSARQHARELLTS